MSETATVRIKESLYYSQHDENVFFKWLKRVRSVTRIHGELDTLFIEVRADRFDQKDLREILTLFRRYNIDLRAVAALETADNRTWLRDRSRWWYRYVFPSDRGGRRASRKRVIR